MQNISIIDLFFDLVFLIDCVDYFLTYGNIKMTRQVIYMQTFTFIVQYNFCFSLCTFSYLFLKLFWLWCPRRFRYYIIYGIFISVKILSLNLFGMELIYHMKLGDLCEKNYLHFFFMSIYFSINVVQLLLKLYDFF